MTSRRTLLAAGLAASTLSTLPLSAMAQEKSIRLIVPFPPGGGGDTLARSVTEDWAQLLGMKLYHDYRPGAGGTIGARLGSEAKPDGMTITYVTNGIFCTNPVLYPNIPFDPMTALRPVGALSTIGLIAAINPKAVPGVTDLKSLISYAKANPGKIDFASAGNGNTSHIAGYFFSQCAGIEMTHVPYKGGAAAMLDVLAGRIPLIIDVAPNVLPHVRSGKLVAIGVPAAERLKIAPEIPTFEEQGIRGFELAAWDGFAVPAKTPDAVVQKLNGALNEALRRDEVIRRLGAKGAAPSYGSAEAFGRFIESERPKWKRLIEAVKAKTD